MADGRGRLCQVRRGGRTAGWGRRRSHCHNLRRGGRGGPAVKLPLSTLPETSIRNLTGTSGPHGTRTSTPLARTARSSVLTRMPGLVTSRRLPPWTATSSCSDGHQVTFVADACGTQTALGHDIALRRMEHEGITLATTASLVAQLAGDYPSFAQIMSG